MLSFNLFTAVLVATAVAQSYHDPNGDNSTTLGPNAEGKYEISAKGIRGLFIPYGASITNLFVNDSHGIERDIVLGFDNATHYEVDRFHPHLGGVPGRYANRIKNSSFVIDGTEYHVTPNENNNNDTLHGGPDGWDFRNFTVVAHTKDSITFSIVDPDGKEGFPGEVVSYITYTMSENTWHMKMVAFATTKKTPIMLSSHTYWNLDGFQNNETATALNHTLYMPYSGQRIGTDGILIPNGTILPNEQYGVNDFWSAPKQIGANWTSPDLEGNCGTNCTGYDTCYLVNRAQNGPYDWRTSGPVATLASPWSGIQVDIFTDQEAFQVYSCGGQNGTLPIKSTQGFTDGSRPRVVEQFGCVVMEVEDWIDAINQPEWQRNKKHIFGPGDDPYVLQASYVFSVNPTAAMSPIQQGVR
ncbi:galactose mutarotase-like protein [Delitschia confertaspora ATCC 74209]|uniref:Galactose mutarotase-like protein n=1 Tax=Delitschia confertaspora ATCC 74209 TaxID=1513339 RepID=A0A9P4JJC1_9PLEO|nr:galactose mutarotase-like protein [Delitschia confertaspora ATCC 74209]